MNEEDKSLLFKATLVLVGYTLVKNDVLNPLLEFLGLKDTKEEKAASEAEQKLVTEGIWSATLWKSPPQKHAYKILTAAFADKYAQTIWNAKGGFYGFGNDDENAVFGVFEALSYQTQVSFLSWTFYNKYNTSLYNYIEPKDGFLSTDEFNKVVATITRLPFGLIDAKGNVIK